MKHFQYNFVFNSIDTEYEQKIKHLENHNQLLNDEVQQVRLNNRVMIFFVRNSFGKKANS